MQTASFPLWLNMDFPERLTHLRKQKQLTQQALADAVDISATILKRYEAGKAQPTLPVLRRLAIVLGVSGDALLFDANERGPSDDLRLHFEAVARMSAEDRQVVRSLLEGMILKHDAKRFIRSEAQNP
jgi:transcriptional regulator with XRE-family HTH domain